MKRYKAIFFKTWLDKFGEKQESIIGSHFFHFYPLGSVNITSKAFLTCSSNCLDATKLVIQEVL
jgi:hypothetical protein